MKKKGYRGGGKMKTKGYKAGGKMKTKGYNFEQVLTHRLSRNSGSAAVKKMLVVIED